MPINHARITQLLKTSRLRLSEETGAHDPHLVLDELLHLVMKSVPKNAVACDADGSEGHSLRLLEELIDICAHYQSRQDIREQLLLTIERYPCPLNCGC